MAESATLHKAISFAGAAMNACLCFLTALPCQSNWRAWARVGARKVCPFARNRQQVMQKSWLDLSPLAAATLEFGDGYAGSSDW